MVSSPCVPSSLLTRLLPVRMSAVPVPRMFSTALTLSPSASPPLAVVSAPLAPSVTETPLPERLIGADPEFYLQWFLRNRAGEDSLFAEEAFAEYARCFRDPATIHGICEDYRASATVDLEHDREDRKLGRRIECPLLALWGAKGVIARCFDALAEWRRVASDVSGGVFHRVELSLDAAAIRWDRATALSRSGRSPTDVPGRFAGRHATSHRCVVSFY